METLRNDSSKPNGKEDRLKKNMFAGYRPIFWFSRIFGSIPFSIVCNSNGEVQSCKMKKADWIFMAVSLCVYLSIIFNLYCTLSSKFDHQRQIAMLVMTMGLFIVASLSFIFGTQLILINMCNRHKLVDILKNFDRFDKEVKRSIF